MHPIILEQLARNHGDVLRRRAEHRRQVALARQPSPARHRGGVRLAVAGVALHLARSLDPDGRVAAG